MRKMPSSPRVDKCKHYWIIESANGTISKGICKYCGEVGVFYNSLQLPNEGKVKRDKAAGKERKAMAEAGYII